MTSHTLRRQLVEMGRLDLGIRCAKCVPMLLVTGNEENIWSPAPIRHPAYPLPELFELPE
jgi:hypothetical protein